MDELSRVPPAVWAVVAGAAAVLCVLWWVWGWYLHLRARRALRAAVTGGAADHLINALVPDGMGGGFHVDFLLLTMRGVIVIDLRDVRGNIFGGDQMAEWTVMDGPRRFTFINPQSALYDRIAAVRAVTGDVPVEGRIVFTRRARFPKGLPKWTLMVDALRAEFPPVEYQSHAEATAPLHAGWRRLKEAVKPSYMADMR